MDKQVFDWLTGRDDHAARQVELPRNTALQRWRGVAQSTPAEQGTPAASTDTSQQSTGRGPLGNDCRFGPAKLR